MDSKPIFRHQPSGDLTLQPTPEAVSVATAYSQGSAGQFRAKKAARVRRDAAERVAAGGGDPDNGQLVLSESAVQFGQYRGHTFKWLLDNDVGYTAHVLATHQVSLILCSYYCIIII